MPIITNTELGEPLHKLQKDFGSHTTDPALRQPGVTFKDIATFLNDYFNLSSSPTEQYCHDLVILSYTFSMIPSCTFYGTLFSECLLFKMDVWFNDVLKGPKSISTNLYTTLLCDPAPVHREGSRLPYVRFQADLKFSLINYIFRTSKLAVNF